MISALILDTETTGFTDPVEVIELAFKPVGPSGHLEVFRFKPSKMIEWGAVATHHILMEDLEGKPPAHEACLNIPEADYLIGHNIDYDWNVLGHPEGKRICTLAMARDLWPELDSHSLGAMMYFTQGANLRTRERLRGAHSAGDGVLMCESVLEAIMHVTKINTLAGLYEFSEEARIPKIMTFGKFKGQPISAVDRGYMNWYRKQPDTDPYVLEAFRRNGL